MWYLGNFGNADDGNDYISEKIRHIPMSKIHIESTNEYDQEASKTWTLAASYQGWSYYDLFSNLFDTAFTEDLQASDTNVPSYGFENDPIMQIGGALKVKEMNEWDGCRLLPSA